MKIVSLQRAKELGLPRFFTGLPCKRGHLSERSTKWRACLECQKAKHQEWLKSNPDRVKAHSRKAYHKDIDASRAKLRQRKFDDPEKFKRFAKASYQKHREKRIATVRKRYEDKRDQCIASMRRWNAKNPEKRRAIALKWARAHIDKILAWRGSNMDRVRVYSRLSKAKRRQVEGKFTKADIARIHKQQRGLCAYCRASLDAKYHVDHINPIASGGTNWPANLQLCCPNCNYQKNAKDPIEYARSTGRLL